MATNGDNKVAIVAAGGLPPLIALLADQTPGAKEHAAAALAGERPEVGTVVMREGAGGRMAAGIDALIAAAAATFCCSASFVRSASRSSGARYEKRQAAEASKYPYAPSIDARSAALTLRSASSASASSSCDGTHAASVCGNGFYTIELL